MRVRSVRKAAAQLDSGSILVAVALLVQIGEGFADKFLHEAEEVVFLSFSPGEGDDGLIRFAVQVAAEPDHLLGTLNSHNSMRKTGARE